MLGSPCQSVERLDPVHPVAASDPGNLESGLDRLVGGSSHRGGNLLDVAEPASRTIVLLIHRLSREKKIAPEVPETSVQRPDAYFAFSRSLLIP